MRSCGAACKFGPEWTLHSKPIKHWFSMILFSRQLTAPNLIFLFFFFFTFYFVLLKYQRKGEIENWYKLLEVHDYDYDGNHGKRKAKIKGMMSHTLAA